MDVKLLQLIEESRQEEIANRTAETRDNKAFLRLIGYVKKSLMGT